LFKSKSFEKTLSELGQTHNIFTKTRLIQVESKKLAVQVTSCRVTDCSELRTHCCLDNDE